MIVADSAPCAASGLVNSIPGVHGIENYFILFVIGGIGLFMITVGLSGLIGLRARSSSSGAAILILVGVMLVLLVLKWHGVESVNTLMGGSSTTTTTQCTQ